MSDNFPAVSEPQSSTSIPANPDNAQIDQSAITLIDTVEGIASLIKDIKGLPISPPSLYIDLEGINLSRDGSISILQIYSLPAQHTYLVDVHSLNTNAFLAKGEGGDNLKNILESEKIPKVFFDVRNDSDALYSHFGIHLRGIEDLQLMELATRTSRRKFVSGLAKCIEFDAPLTICERRDWLESKRAGQRLFAPEKGGNYEVFNRRPLAEDIMQYCANDVHILPRLWAHYNGRFTSGWRGKMLAESVRRVELSHSPFFSGKGRHMAEAPSGW